MKTIFYSWQSDLPSHINREFIQDSIEEAIKIVNQEVEIDTSPRKDDQILELDHNTRNTPGSPPIVQTIFDKIDKCEMFLADLTFVAKALKKNPTTKKFRLVPNPNVLIEYGYACKSKGYDRIISVMNTAYGKPISENVPFNIRHLRFPIGYNLEPNSEDILISDVRDSLVEELIPKIELILGIENRKLGSLSTELLVDNSIFYIERNLRRALLIPHLKVTNSNSNATNVNLKSLMLKVENNWLEATRSNFAGDRIDTNRATVHLPHLKNKLIKYGEGARIDGFGSHSFYFPFEVDIREFKEIITKYENLPIKGVLNSLDGRNSTFKGELKSYR